MTSPHFISDDFDLGLSLRDVATTEQTQVVVVVTTLRGRHRPEFDAEALAGEVPEARVLVVPDHLSVRGVAERLGEGLGVYGGAARVYPIRVPGVPYQAPTFPLQYRDAAAVFPRLVQATRDAVAKAARASAPVARGFGGGPVTGVLLEAKSSSQVAQVDTPALAYALAQHLLEPARSRPVLLVTRRAGAAAPEVDVNRIQAETTGLVDIFEMPTGDVSWAFSEALSAFPGTECYGGAARVYPVGLEWTTNLARSPLRFTWNPEVSDQSTQNLIRDVLAATQASGHKTVPETARRAAGRVEGIVSGRILVTLDGGGVATIWPELTVPGLAAEQLAVSGMAVKGVLDQSAGRLDITAQLALAQQVLAGYRTGALVLARVVAVERELAVLELYPEVQAAVPAREIIAGRFVVDVRQWLTEGECVIARVVQPGTSHDDWELSLLDIDPDDTPLPAPALLPGGPPWLTHSPVDDEEPVEAVAEEETQPQVEATPAPLTKPTEPARSTPPEQPSDLADQLRVMTVERDALRRDLGRELAVSGRLDHELRTLRTRARDLESKATRAAKKLASAEASLAAFEDARADRELDRVAFLDPEQQFRYEIYLEWARRIPAAEKEHLPKRDYQLGDDFLTTLAAISERDRAKAVEVVVDVITGRVHQLAGRRVHQLRSGPGPNDPYMARKDGSTCWRVSLQEKTPQARRLHYWQLPDGTCELASVENHDDIQH